MQTKQISFEIPEAILHTLNQTQEEFVSQARLLMALQLFKIQKLTFMQAAELAGMDRTAFLVTLDQHAIPVIDYDPAELEEEIQPNCVT